MNYFNTSRLALSCAFGLMVWAQMQTGAFAQKAPVDFGDSILSVPLPAPKLANAEIGELRGLIYQDHLDKVHLDKVQRDEVHRDGENRSNVAHTQSFEHSSLSNPGLVHHAEPGIQIDRIVTGTPFRYSGLAGIVHMRRRLLRDMASVDPARDTPEILSEYLSSFDPRIIGISGNKKAVERSLKAFKVYFKRAELEDGDYTMDHTTIIYLLNSMGEFAGSISYGEDQQSAVSKLRRLID